MAGPREVSCCRLDTAVRREALIFDRHAFGAERSKLLEMLIDDCCVTPLVTTTTDGHLAGYGLARPGSAAIYAGPLVAASRDAAMTLLDGLLSQVSGKRVYVDLNTNFLGGRKILTERGFVKQ